VEPRGQPDNRARGSLPILPSVGLGPDEPEEAQNPNWDPLKSRRDDAGLPDKPITRSRRLLRPGLAILCGLLLIAAAYVLIELDDADDGKSNERPTIFDAIGTPPPYSFVSPKP
jgi:hypothetical protein